MGTRTGSLVGTSSYGSGIVGTSNPDRSQSGLTHVPAEKIDYWIAEGRRVVNLPAITPASAAVYIPSELDAAIARIEAGGDADE